MSQKPSQVNRSRPNSIKLDKKFPNMPQEYITHPPQEKSNPIYAIKIEDKLRNNQIATNKRLELLKKNLEQEELKELRSKPTILEKSRILAEKAEKKLFENFVKPPTETKQIENTEKVYTQVQPDLHNRSVSHVKISIEKIISSRVSSRTPKKRHKSLLNLSVLERGEAWLSEKQKKIDANKKMREMEELAECTFSPTPKTRDRSENRSTREAGSNNLSMMSNGHSVIEHVYEHEQNAGPKQRPSLYKKIAPYQVNISFKCGIDIKSFLRRAK